MAAPIPVDPQHLPQVFNAGVANIGLFLKAWHMDYYIERIKE
jgi:hypothetical protein